MSLNTVFESSTQKEFDVLSQTTYSSRLDVCRLKSKKTQQEFIGLILKEKDPEKRKKFFENRKHSEEIRAFVAEGYKGDAFLPETRLGKGEMILTPYAGEYLKEELYNSLSPEEQKKVQKDFASFLNHMHQKAYSGSPFLKKIPYFEKLSEKEHLPPLDPCIDSYLDRLYTGLGFSKEFITGVIKEYNKLTQETAHPSPVSLKKLEILWKLAQLNDQSCWIIELGRDPKFAYDTFMKKWKKLNPPKQTRDGR